MRGTHYILPAVAVAAAAVLFGCEQAGAGSSRYPSVISQ
mgnify:CR=1 FL=1